MYLTKDDSVNKCRFMWNWIADETERLNRVVQKNEYFKHFNIDVENIPNSGCYLCEYDMQFTKDCKHCPLDFGVCFDEEQCVSAEGSPYGKWQSLVEICDAGDQIDIKELADFARQIANLPERQLTESFCLSHKIIEILEQHGFTYGKIYEQENDYYTEISQYTPTWEDWFVGICFDGTNEDFANQVKKYWENFDVDEEVEIWIDSRCKNGVPSSILTLVEDAQWKKDKLGELSDDLSGIEWEEWLCQE